MNGTVAEPVPENASERIPRSSCGHRTRHIVRLPARSGPTDMCVACWRQRRDAERARGIQHQDEVAV